MGLTAVKVQEFNVQSLNGKSKIGAVSTIRSLYLRLLGKFFSLQRPIF